jgi:hypothetical protein
LDTSSDASTGLRQVSSQSEDPYFSFCHYCLVAFALPNSFLLFCHFSDIFTVYGIQFWLAARSGMSLSALEARTDLGMCQMKMAPSVPAVTMNCWLGEIAIYTKVRVNIVNFEARDTLNLNLKNT